MNGQRPLLSIGMIFKNEIRCIERCLKSLQPLRDALPCELVMADTGADDGSREIAEQYADILIDFPWIGDFSAARNAVLERCSGTWYMSIDCDEWVDSDIEGYVAFLTSDRDFDFASVVIRNYDTIELDRGGTFSDFLAVRLLRMATGIRYEGKIHEHWPYQGDLRTMLIRNAVFHHDGYVYQDQDAKEKKQKRNMDILRKEIEKDPDNLIVLTQCIESGDNYEEQGAYIRRAMEGVDKKRPQWELFGPPVYCYAVRYALANKLPEVEEWIEKGSSMFPKSIFIRAQMSYYAFGYFWEKDDYDKSIYWGEMYLQGVADYYSGNFDRANILASSLGKIDSHSKLSVAVVLASGYLHEKQPEKCLRLMESLELEKMDVKQIGDCVRNICNMHSHFEIDTVPFILRLWNEVDAPYPDQSKADQRRTAFLQVGAGMFEGGFIRAERDKEDVLRQAYEVFLPLAGKCILGDAAQILETRNPVQLENLLRGVDELSRCPSSALAHALACGVRFPLPDHPLMIDEMDALIAGIAQDTEGLLTLVRQQADDKVLSEEGQALCWARGMCIAAIRVCDWTNVDWEAGILLVRDFVRIERVYLTQCYAPKALTESGLFRLPAMHRFGWYCVQAFDALDANDTTNYVRLLREGLNVCEGMKALVEFLMDNTPELQKPLSPSGELQALAEQVRTILAQFSPDDPAVVALKQSEAYQKVAYLIEEPAPPTKGGHVLMVAYFFPPLSGSGVFRSIKFAKYLPLFGWEPTVLSTDCPPEGWEFSDNSQMREIPETMEVVRIPDEVGTGRKKELDFDYHQALLGFLQSVLRYSPVAERIFSRVSQTRDGIATLCAFPCFALSWAYEVTQYIEKHMDLKRFQAIYTTSGPNSAHLVGFYLKQKYGIPWVADYRDPWTFNPYGAEYDPNDVGPRLMFELESILLQYADKNLTIESSLAEIYIHQFGLKEGSVASITNGYDEADFADLEMPQRQTDRFTINYSGILYSQQRSIVPVLEAVRQLNDEKKIELSKLRFRIVGACTTDKIEEIERYHLGEVIEYTGYLSHKQALQANLSANLLLLLVGDEPKFKWVYTGKIFEYLRSGRPILALAPRDGVVDRLLRESGHGEAYLSTEISEIKAMILREYQKWERGEVPELLHSPVIEQFERKVLTKQLADVLSNISQNKNPLLATSSGGPESRATILVGGSKFDQHGLEQLADSFLRQNYSYVWLKAMLKKASEATLKNAVLVTGSSYGVNGIVESSWLHAVNCSASSQDLYYDFLCTQKALSDRPKDRFSRCFIVDGYYVACHDLSLGKQERERAISNIYYPIFRDGHNWYEVRSNDLWSGFGHISDEEKLRCEQLAIEKISKQGTYFSTLKQRGGTVFDLNGRNWWDVPAEERRSLGKIRAESHNRLFQHNNTIEENKKILKEYVHFLYLNGVTPIFLIAPFTTEYTQFISQEMKESVSELIAAVPKDIKFVDFNQVSCFDPTDFVDTDHLSQKGAEKFSRMLVEFFGR